jgi:hypothetical protein
VVKKPASTETGRPIRRWLAWLLLGLGAVMVVVFGLRAVHQIEYAKRVESGQIQVASLRGWMTLPYIAQTYGVPEAQLRAALGVPATGDEKRSLRVWFAVAGIEPESGWRAIEAVILTAQSAGPARPPSE